MQQGRYEFAGHWVEINSIYPRVHQMCSDYQTRKEPEFCIRISPEDIRMECNRPKAECRKEGFAFRDFSDEYLETLAVYRKLSEWLIDQDTMLFHGSAISVDGQGYLFTARSGVGKSTHTSLWSAVFGERAVMINDDKPLLHIGKQGVTVYGTPWDGKHHRSSNRSVPLQGICILTRDTQNHIRTINKTQAYPMLLAQTYRSMNPAKMAKTLALIDLLATTTKLYELGCNMEPEAARVAYEGMRFMG